MVHQITIFPTVATLTVNLLVQLMVNLFSSSHVTGTIRSSLDGVLFIHAAQYAEFPTLCNALCGGDARRFEQKRKLLELQSDCTRPCSTDLQSRVTVSIPSENAGQ